MSDGPGYPFGTSVPPLPPSGGRTGPAWEGTGEFAQRYVDTVRGVLTDPKAFYASMRLTGGLQAPVTFALVGLGILMLSLLGAARQPFEATARVVAYGVGATSLLGLIPFCGGIIGGLYGIYLYIVGLADVHDTDITKAAIAVLTPAVVCCVLFALLWGTIAALIFGAAAAGLATQ